MNSTDNLQQPQTQPQPNYTITPSTQTMPTETTPPYNSVQPMPDLSQPQPSVTTTELTTDVQAPAVKKGGSKALLFLFVLLLFVILGGLGFFIYGINSGLIKFAGAPNAPEENKDDKQDENKDDELTATDPITYNDTLVAAQKKVVNEFLKYSVEIKRQGADQTSTLTVINNSKTEIATTTTKISTLNAYQGGDNFKQAAINLLSFYNNSLDTHIKEMVTVYFSTTLNTVQKNTQINDLTQKFVAAEKPLVDAFAAAQQEFATLHNVRLIENKPLDIEVSDKFDSQ